jgi:uncharacterized membrane protein
MLSTKVKAFLKNRMKNKMLWIGVVSLLVELNLEGVIDLPSNFEPIASSVLNVLVLLGILNNPSTESQSLFVDNDNDGIADEFQKDDNEQAKG